MMRITFLICLSLLITFCGVLAQNNSSENMDTVYVSASRIPQKIVETGRNITVIKGEEISRLPVHSIDELLRYIPGIEVQLRNGFGVQGDISMRGSTFTQVLILIDGVRFNDPLTGHFNAYIPVTMAEIDRIEVMRGAATADYGADAVGGVINIITKTFNPLNTVPKSEAAVSAMYGHHNTISTNAGFFHDSGKLKLGGGMQSHKSDGHDLPSGLNGDFDIKTFSGSLAYRVREDMELMYRTAYDYRDFNAQYFYTRSAFDLSHETATNLWNHLAFRYTQDEHTTELNVNYKRTTDEFLFNPAFGAANEHTTQSIGAQINHRRKINDKLTFNFGFQTDYRSIESNDRGDHNNTRSSLYTIGFYQPVKGLSLTGSLRAEVDDNDSFELLPQLNATYNVKNLVIRLMGGRTARVPDYTERYVSNNLAGPLSAGRNLGNPAVQPETTWNLEQGMDYFPLKGLKLTYTGFWRQSKNLIDFVSTPASEIENNGNLMEDASYFYIKNFGEVRVLGFEGEISYRKKINDNWTVNGGVGVMVLDISTPDEDQALSKYLSNNSSMMVSTQLAVTHPRFGFSVNGLWKNRDADIAEGINAVLNEKYMVWNVQADVWIIKQELAASLKVNNIFNEDYQDILGAQLPGTWIMGGLKWNWSK